jgi:hypothetical protein
VCCVKYQTLRSSYRSYIKPTAPNARSDTQGPTLRQASFFLPDFCSKICQVRTLAECQRPVSSRNKPYSGGSAIITNSSASFAVLASVAGLFANGRGADKFGCQPGTLKERQPSPFRQGNRICKEAPVEWAFSSRGRRNVAKPVRVPILVRSRSNSADSSKHCRALWGQGAPSRSKPQIGLGNFQLRYPCPFRGGWPQPREAIVGQSDRNMP